MSDRGNCWSVTINNPVAADEEAISSARQRSGWIVVGQLEKGENGTPHYQLMLKTPQVRFSAVKKLFPRAHIEKARNSAALGTYVQKEETRIGELVENNEMYPTLQTAFDMFSSWLHNRVLHNIDANYQSFTPEVWLDKFDAFCAAKITEGYVLETLAVNPQVRSSIKKFGCEIYIRSNIRRQKTDRQTELIARQALKHADEEELCEADGTESCTSETSHSS